MKINKIFLSASLAVTALCANAQTVTEQEVTEYDFKPSWYIQAQIGGQETLGETSFSKLGSLNAQLAVGYQFNHVMSARIAFNGWQSRAGSNYDNGSYKWKWNYVSPTFDVTADLVSLFGGFNPNRLVSAGILAGIGANIAWNNDEAVAANGAINKMLYGDLAADQPDALGNLWTGTKARFMGRLGVFCDFRVSDRVKIGLELQANVLNDNYNSKRAKNADWYFNGLVGVKYNFGIGYTKRTRTLAQATNSVTEVVEKIVEVPVEKIVEKVVYKEVPGPLHHDIFFKISTTKVTKDEMFKVAEIARFLKENPQATAKVTGYADKGTGSLQLNLRLAAERANAVKECLVKDFGIDPSRIATASMGDDTYQPYSLPELNRVAIIVAK